jgi:hypothetical protein
MAYVVDVVRRHGCDVLAVGLDVEQALAEQGITYISSKAFRTVETPERLKQARRLGERLQKGLEAKHFVYKKISLGRLYKPTFQYYFAILFYYIDIFTEVISERYTIVYVFSPSTCRKGAVPFEKLVTRAVITSLELSNEKKLFEVKVLPRIFDKNTITKCRKSVIRLIYRNLQLFGLSLLNIYMTYGRRRMNISILASEYWKNIKALLEEGKDTELILLDRSEAITIGLKNILKHRMRFIHPETFLSRGKKTLLQKESQNLVDAWSLEFKYVGDSIPDTYKELNLSKTISNACQTILEDTISLILKIEGTTSMIKKISPDCVLVRAGISIQTHFAVLCEVAREAGIPSIENQHGILSGFEGDFTSNPHSEYIASYGILVREELEKHNFAPQSTFLEIGSPRFDVYSTVSSLREHAPSEIVNILHIGPPLSPGLWTDSYDVKVYFESLAQACCAIPAAHVTIKLRGHDIYEEFYRRCIKDALGTIPHTIAVTESLPTLFETSDIVVSCHSTAYLEALVAGRPVIIDATLPIFRSLADTDLAVFEAEEVLTVVRTPEAYAGALERLSRSPLEQVEQGEKARRFVDSHFVLGDGRSSERLAKAIYSLVGK